jgi:hypothetical protein
MSNRDHVTIHQLPGSRTGMIYCGYCTGAIHFALPMRATDLVALIKSYEERHEQCQQKKA